MEALHPKLPWDVIECHLSQSEEVSEAAPACIAAYMSHAKSGRLRSWWALWSAQC